MNYREKQQLQAIVLHNYNAMMSDLYKQFGYKDTAAIRLYTLEILTNHILSKTRDALRAKVRPSTKQKKLVKQAMESNYDNLFNSTDSHICKTDSHILKNEKENQSANADIQAVMQ